VKIGNINKSADFTDKSTDFQKTGVAISGQFLLEPGQFLSKIGK
jgi:hypothetical protein